MKIKSMLMVGLLSVSMLINVGCEEISNIDLESTSYVSTNNYDLITEIYDSHDISDYWNIEVKKTSNEKGDYEGYFVNLTSKEDDSLKVFQDNRNDSKYYENFIDFVETLKENFNSEGLSEIHLEAYFRIDKGFMYSVIYDDENGVTYERVNNIFETKTEKELDTIEYAFEVANHYTELNSDNNIAFEITFFNSDTKSISFDAIVDRKLFEEYKETENWREYLEESMNGFYEVQQEISEKMYNFGYYYDGVTVVFIDGDGHRLGWITLDEKIVINVTDEMLEE